jgi:hypothetical protein
VWHNSAFVGNLYRWQQYKDIECGTTVLLWGIYIAGNNINILSVAQQCFYGEFMSLATIYRY